MEGSEAKIVELEKLVVQQSEDIKKLIEENRKITEKVSSVTVDEKPNEKKLIPTKEFTVGKKKYKFKVAQFRLAGQVVKAADALEDSKLLGDIVTKYSPLVEEVK